MMKISASLAFVASANVRESEVWTSEQEIAAGIVPKGNHSGSHDLLSEPESYPDEFSWCNKDGENFCTMSRNQHIPQYCGSCWAHGAVSALGDRIKISRKARAVDINLSVQHILNCGDVGSCHGGSIVGPYDWLYRQGAKGISYETSNPYMACSSENQEGICPGQDWSCTDMNVA